MTTVVLSMITGHC